MTRYHTTWTQEQLEAAVAADRESTQGGEAETFDAFASTLPESESDVEQPQASTASATPQPPSTTNVKTDAASRKLQAKMAKMKREFSNLIPRAFESALLRKGPTWAMSKEQKDMLTDAVESVFDVLDVSFSVQQYNVELKSRIWVFLYPVVIGLGIFGLIAARNQGSEPIKEEKSEEPVLVQ
jgi:hypothetical protein